MKITFCTQHIEFYMIGINSLPEKITTFLSIVTAIQHQRTATLRSPFGAHNNMRCSIRIISSPTAGPHVFGVRTISFLSLSLVFALSHSLTLSINVRVYLFDRNKCIKPQALVARFCVLLLVVLVRGFILYTTRSITLPRDKSLNSCAFCSRPEPQPAHTHTQHTYIHSPAQTQTTQTQPCPIARIYVHACAWSPSPPPPRTKSKHI